MSFTFIHTADWQIGKPYARIEDAQKRALVRQERLTVVERIALVAQEKKAQFILVAGDLFDSPTPDKATVSAACAAIGALKMPVYAIPGNHDHGGAGSLWEQPFFLQECALLSPNLKVLLRPEPTELEDAWLFPCPLLRRHDSADTTAWLRAWDYSSCGEKSRIVLAHGSVQEFGPTLDEEEAADSANQLDLSRLPVSEIDYVALGDWHGCKDVSVLSPKGKINAWYSGTPEPDRYPRGSGNLPGHVLAVTLQRPRNVIVEPLRTARLGWSNVDFSLTDDAAVTRLDEELASLFQSRIGQDLLRLTLDGSLGIAAWDVLEKSLETWRSRLLRLRLHVSVSIAPTEEEIGTLIKRADAPLTSRVAKRLLEESQSTDADVAETARHALRILYASLTPS